MHAIRMRSTWWRETEAICSAKNRPPLTPDQRQIWDLLSGRVMSGKEIANTIGRDLCSEDAVRQRIRRMVGNGWQIKNTRGSGYWRPVAPPHGLATG